MGVDEEEAEVAAVVDVEVEDVEEEKKKRMGSNYQIGKISQGWKDQVPSRDLLVFSSHQRVRNYRLLHWTCIERRSLENYACPKTNSCRSKNSLQGIRCNWRLQRTCRSRS